MNQYLIPANSKKSILIFGLFNMTDIWIFGGGLVVSLILLLALPVDELIWALVAITPGIITGLLVMPIPNYHNIRTIIILAYTFYTTRQRFIWKGWCFGNGEDTKEQVHE